MRIDVLSVDVYLVFGVSLHFKINDLAVAIKTKFLQLVGAALYYK